MAAEATLTLEPPDLVLAEQDTVDDDAPRGSVAAPHHRALDDVPLRSKQILLVALASVGGVLVGTIAADSSQRLWSLIIGLTALLALLMWLCDWWLWAPMDKLVQQLDSIRLRTAPRVIHNLPAARCDEIGKIARTVQQVAISSLRNEFEANRVRRTMDARIESQTRAATQHLRRMALRDPLTDLGNRRFLEEHFELLVATTRKAGQDLVCIAVDLDNFKQVNDTMGHDAGDDLLLFLASILRGCIRRNDMAVRLGGDEFLLLLPGCEMSQAAQVIERIHSLFRSHVRNTAAASLGADLSVGVASLVRDGLESGQDLLKKADEYLYEAKRAGKGRLAGAWTAWNALE